MAPSTAALCWCAHCGAVRRLRAEGELASCGTCGRVLLELRGDAAAVAAPRRQRQRRRTESSAATAGRRKMGADVVGARAGREEISDAESTAAPAKHGASMVATSTGLEEEEDRRIEI
ncbi:hypothetical protein BS78_09G134900 [Paspalum vaginatum]|nr:hypothetical protein BS78_09G134900 [Paspalum vaginatum]